MKRFLICFYFFLFVAAITFAQGTLQFSQVIILTNSPQTVPAGKVWKATSVYGRASNVCYYLPSRSSSSSYLVSRGFVGGFNINGTDIISTATRTDGNLYINNDCTGSTSSYTYNDARDNWISDPNILPLWLPAGTVVKTLGSTIFLSVIEFNIIP